MRLSTKGRHAITAMLELALSTSKKPTTLAVVSEKQGISLSYLEQIFSLLRSKQLVRGVRGPGGGYQLARPAREISVAEIICAVDDWSEFNRRAKLENCSDGSQSLPHALWNHFSEEVFIFLNAISLADLVNRRRSDRFSGDRPGGFKLREDKRAA